MSDNTMVCIIAALAISSCTACTVTEKLTASNEKIAMTPEQICVSKSLFNEDRIACMKGKP